MRLGECDRIDEVMIGEDKLIRFSGCKGGQACTIVLRGASSHLLEEADRSLHDALAVLQQTLLHPERTASGYRRYGAAEEVAGGGGVRARAASDADDHRGQRGSGRRGAGGAAACGAPRGSHDRRLRYVGEGGE